MPYICRAARCPMSQISACATKIREWPAAVLHDVVMRLAQLLLLKCVIIWSRIPISSLRRLRQNYIFSKCFAHAQCICAENALNLHEPRTQPLICLINKFKWLNNHHNSGAQPRRRSVVGGRLSDKKYMALWYIAHESSIRGFSRART